MKLFFQVFNYAKFSSFPQYFIWISRFFFFYIKSLFSFKNNLKDIFFENKNGLNFTSFHFILFKIKKKKKWFYFWLLIFYLNLILIMVICYFFFTIYSLYEIVKKKQNDPQRWPPWNDKQGKPSIRKLWFPKLERTC